jgi:predicted site-specific integrase-resolvase
MTAKEVMLKYRITRQTLYRWRRDGVIEYKTTPSGRYIYGVNKSYESVGEKEITIQKIVIYARVSTSGQKENLERQIKRLKQFAIANGMIVDDVYSEIASALNYNRKKFNKILNDIFDGKVKIILIEYKDRLVRVGFDHFENICKRFGVKIIVADQTEDTSKDKQKEIINDLVSIMHHFSAKIYSLRKNKKKIETLLNANN